MKIPIPKFYDRAMDWLACHIFPPHKPSGLRLFGHDISWTDLTIVGYTLAIAAALWWLTGSLFWPAAVVLGTGLMAIWML